MRLAYKAINQCVANFWMNTHKRNPLIDPKAGHGQMKEILTTKLWLRENWYWIIYEIPYRRYWYNQENATVNLSVWEYKVDLIWASLFY